MMKRFSKVNSKIMEVKVMKKIVFLTSMLIALLVFAGVSSAIVINSGPFGAKYLDNSFADFPYNTAEFSNLPLAPGQDSNNITGNIWGIISLTTVHTLVDNNPENNNLSGVAYYNAGSDGKYYFAVYGGLTYLSGNSPGELRMQAANGITPYLKVYETTNPNLYDLSNLAGPNASGAGAFGTFGTNIIYGVDGLPGTGDDPTLWLDMTFSANTLAAYDGSFQPGELELVTFSSAVTGSSEAYLDILGGTGAALFQTGVFDLAHALTGTDRADMKVISDLTANFSGSTQQWTNANGWTTNSQDPITGAGVPEPSCFILLGAGLLSIKIFCRKRMKK
jgi:hypothetical protein